MESPQAAGILRIFLKVLGSSALGVEEHFSVGWIGSGLEEDGQRLAQRKLPKALNPCPPALREVIMPDLA